MTAELDLYLAIGAGLFVLGAIGFLTRRNLIMIMLSAEMMLHGVSLTLVTFGRHAHTNEGQVFTIFTLVVAACEAGLGLALVLALYQNTKSLDVELWTELREDDLPPPAMPNEHLPAEEVQTFPRLTPAGLPPRPAHMLDPAVRAAADRAAAPRVNS